MAEEAVPWLELTVDQAVWRRVGHRATVATMEALMEPVLRLGLVGRVLGQLSDRELRELAGYYQSVEISARLQREMHEQRRRAMWADVLRQAAQRPPGVSPRPHPVDHKPPIHQAGRKPNPKQVSRRQGLVFRPPRG